MTYRVVVTPSATRCLTRLPAKITEAVVEFIYGPLAENPRRVGKPLLDQFEGQHSARRGSYRVRYRIVEAEVVAQVLYVAHRSDAYRP